MPQPGQGNPVRWRNRHRDGIPAIRADPSAGKGSSAAPAKANGMIPTRRTISPTRTTRRSQRETLFVLWIAINYQTARRTGKLRDALRYNQHMPLMTDFPSAPPLRVTVLGSGTSTGAPVIGCHCATCDSSEPRNKRMRASIVVTPRGGQSAGENILVDTTPDLRTQALRAGLERVNSVLITHTHADHIFGMDDLRQYNIWQPGTIPIHGDAETLSQLRTIFAYCFSGGEGWRPRLELQEIAPFAPLVLCSVPITPLTVFHGSTPILGFAFGSKFAYVTDVSRIPDETLPYLRGLDTLILDAVRREPHPTHFSLSEALAVIAEVKPRRAYLTHLSHDFDYAPTMASLPDGVELAYDGLTLEIPGDEAP